jgi:hypothetical protein
MWHDVTYVRHCVAHCSIYSAVVLYSVATVRFSSVQTLILLNLELNLPELLQEVRFRFSGGSNPELNLKKL